MGQITRKYDFQYGTRAMPDQVDEEFDQLVDAHNEHDARLSELEQNEATVAQLAATNARVTSLETTTATHTEVDQKITQAALGNPPLGGVTTEMLQDGGVTPEKLSFDPATQGDIGAVSAQALNNNRLSSMGGMG